MAKNLVLSRDATGKFLMRVLTNPQTVHVEPKDLKPIGMPCSPQEHRARRDKAMWLKENADFVNNVYDLVFQYIEERELPENHVLELDSACLRAAIKEYVYECSHSSASAQRT
jgi:hypothetical protein